MSPCVIPFYCENCGQPVSGASERPDWGPNEAERAGTVRILCDACAGAAGLHRPLRWRWLRQRSHFPPD